MTGTDTAPDELGAEAAKADAAMARLQDALGRLGDGDCTARTGECTMSVAEWTPLIAGHLTGHVDQAFAIMTDREFLPEGI